MSTGCARASDEERLLRFVRVQLASLHDVLKQQIPANSPRGLAYAFEDRPNLGSSIHRTFFAQTLARLTRHWQG